MIPQYQEKTGHHKMMRMFSLGMDLLGRRGALSSSPSVSISSHSHKGLDPVLPVQLVKVSHTKTHMQGMDFVMFFTKICNLPPSL